MMPIETQGGVHSINEADEFLAAMSEVEFDDSRAGGAESEAPRPSEREAFRRIRSRRRWAWLLFVGYLPVAGGATILLMKMAIPDSVAIGVAIGWTVACGVARASYERSRCPRCTKRCLQGGPWRSPWAGRCAHCGVRLFWTDVELDG
jgi:hypothetical protein